MNELPVLLVTTSDEPSYAHPGDAGADLRSAENLTIPPGERRTVGTGIAIAIPAGYVGLVHPRSGLAAKLGGLAAELLGHGGHFLRGLGNFFFCRGLGLALHGQAIVHQGLEHFSAFLLRFGEGAQAGKPYLLGRLLDRLIEGGRVGRWFFFSHGLSLGKGKGRSHTVVGSVHFV